MKTFKRRHMPALLWAVLGFAVAFLGNQAVLAVQLNHPELGYWHPLTHFDELLTGACFGFMRWLHGEWRWRVEQQYMDRASEQQVRDALTILRHSSSDAARQKALEIIVAKLSANKNVHDDFRDLFR